MSPIRLTALALLLAAFLVTPARAQGEARVSGTVVDAKGAPIAGATIVVTKEGTKLRMEKTSSDKGTFNLLILDASSEYNVHIEKAGFAPLDEKLKVPAGDTTRKTFTLQPPAPRVKVG